MIRANYSDKDLVINILTGSFEANQSVNYIIKQDKKRLARIQTLMSYSFDVCYLFGDVYLSADRNACALVLYPDKKRSTLRAILLDLKLIFYCVGIANLKRTLARESMIKKVQPKNPLYYLWFIGVDPKYQNKGIGSHLLKELIDDSMGKQRLMCLETSTLKNLPWYQKFGLQIYNKLDLGYELFFLKKMLVKK